MAPDVVELRKRRIEQHLSELQVLTTERMGSALAGELPCPGLELENDMAGNDVTMTLRVPPEVAERADDLKSRIHGPMITALTGGRVSRSMVLRLALIEGLQVLERRYSEEGDTNAR